MNKIFTQNYVLALLSGFLLAPGWYEWGTGFTLIVAFVPLFLILDKTIHDGKGGAKAFFLSALGFLTWNVLDIWWVKNASFAGLIAALFVSTFLMSIPVLLAYHTWKRWGRGIGLFSFVVFWISIEFIYMHGEIAFPWLTLGNGFAYEVKVVQWYEVTGVFGGSLWILMLNVLIYTSVFNKNREFGFNVKNFLGVLVVLLVPITLSFIRYYTYTEKENPRKIIVVQPNIDPYLKFNDISSMEQTRIQVEEAAKVSDSTVDFVVAPETSIVSNIWIGHFNSVPEFKIIKNYVNEFPQIRYITGIMCYKLYEHKSELTPTAQHLRDNLYYDTFNSAIQIDTTDNIPIYHKSKLVTGVEKMPYPEALGFLRKIMLELGGTFRSHGTQKDRDVFKSPDDSIQIAPVICYESVFGEFVTGYIKKGADFIFVITNDGWWGNTPGYRQHNSFSSIRAIETRRSIARSANTGMSSFINQRGDVIQSIGWWKRGTLVDTINANDTLTFYVKHGDFIGRISLFTSCILMLSLIVSALKKKN